MFGFLYAYDCWKFVAVNSICIVVGEFQFQLRPRDNNEDLSCWQDQTVQEREARGLLMW